jgi:competence protein ComEA
MSIRPASAQGFAAAFARLVLAAGLTLAVAAAHAGLEVNRANLAELETVKGIGPSLSTRILQAREQATFANWDDLRHRVRGIGTAKAASLSAQGLTVSGAAYAATDSDLAGSQPKKRETSSARASVSDSPRSINSQVNGASNNR